MTAALRAQTGRVVRVTGASAGLGLAIATAFANDGADVTGAIAAGAAAVATPAGWRGLSGRRL